MNRPAAGQPCTCRRSDARLLQAGQHRCEEVSTVDDEDGVESDEIGCAHASAGLRWNPRRSPSGLSGTLSCPQDGVRRCETDRLAVDHGRDFGLLPPEGCSYSATPRPPRRCPGCSRDRRCHGAKPLVFRSARSQQSTAMCNALQASTSRVDPSAQMRSTR